MVLSKRFLRWFCYARGAGKHSFKMCKLFQFIKTRWFVSQGARSITLHFTRWGKTHSSVHKNWIWVHTWTQSETECLLYTYMCVCVVGLHVHIDLRLMSSIFISHSLPYYALRHAPHCTWNSWFQLVWLVSMIWLFSVSASKGLQVGCQAHAWLLCGPRACRVQSSCLYSILRRLLTLI